MARKLIVEIIGDSSSLEKALGKSTAAATGFGARMEAVGSKMTSIGRKMTKDITLPIVAIGALSIKAAMDAETATARLDTAFTNAGLSAKAYSKQIEAAEASGRKLGFTNTEVKASLGSLITSTGDTSKSMRELGISEDLARFKHVDLETATKALTMANAGSMRAIKQLGITIVPVTTNVDALRASHVKLTTEQGRAALAAAKLKDKQETIASVMDIVSAKVKGQGQAFANTAAGGMAQFRAQLENTGEKLGAVLLPILNSLIGYLDRLLTWFQSLSPATQKWILIMAGAAAALGPVLGLVGRISLALRGLVIAFRAVGVASMALAASPTGLLFAGLTLAVGAAAAALYLLRSNLLQTGNEEDFIAAQTKKLQTSLDGLKLSMDALKSAHLSVREAQDGLAQSQENLRQAQARYHADVVANRKDTEQGRLDYLALREAHTAVARSTDTLDEARKRLTATEQAGQVTIQSGTKALRDLGGAYSATFGELAQGEIQMPEFQKRMENLTSKVLDNIRAHRQLAQSLRDTNPVAARTEASIARYGTAVLRVIRTHQAFTTANIQAELRKIPWAEFERKLGLLPAKAKMSGDQTKSKFMAGIGEMMAQAPAKVGATVAGMLSKLQGLPGKFYNVGLAAGISLARGLDASAGAVRAAAARVASAAEVTARNVTQVHSYSPLWGGIGEGMMKSLIQGFLKEMPEVKTAAAKAGQNAAAAAKAADVIAAMEAAGRVIGMAQARAIVQGFLQQQPSLKTQMIQALQARTREAVAAAGQAVRDAKDTFASAFGDLMSAALAAFDAKVAAWVPPAQRILDKMDLQAFKDSLGAAFGDAATFALNQMTLAFAQGAIGVGEDWAKDLEAQMNAAIVAAQGGVDAAQAALAAAQAGGDPDAIAKAQAALDDAKAKLAQLEQLRRDTLARIAAMEQQAHDQKAERDRLAFERELEAAGTNQKKILAALRKYVPEYLAQGKALNDALAAGLQAGLKKVNNAIDDIISAINRLKDVKANITVNVDVSGGGTTGAKALGGPVLANMPYMVGEQGPELFIPGASGKIIPNNQINSIPLYGGANQPQIIQLVVDGKVLAEAVAQPMRQQFIRHSQRN